VGSRALAINQETERLPTAVVYSFWFLPAQKLLFNGYPSQDKFEDIKVLQQ
jgi:hypothetical protein